jgi:chromosome segregation ATPase
MDRDARIRAEMKGLYDKMCDAALQLDAANESAARLEAELAQARAAHSAATAALERTRASATVSVKGFRAQRDAAAIAANTVASAEGWLSSKRVEISDIRARHNRFDERYQQLSKELDSVGAVVVKFTGRPHAQHD